MLFSLVYCKHCLYLQCSSITLKTYIMTALKITVERSATNPTPEFAYLINGIGFWNVNGKNIYERNKAGEMGDKNSQELAKTSTYEDFILLTVASELKSILPSFNVGRSGSHIWISEGNDRIILITF